MAEDGFLQEEVDDNPPFCIMEGSTFFRRKKEWHLFGDFSLKILGEITEGGFWVCAFGTRVLGRHVERRIVIQASAFDSKVKFLERTRKSFGGGTFNINEGALLESYYLFLKEEYNEGVVRRYFAAECIGLQKFKNDYWCLSSEIHVHNGMILPKENQHFLFPNDLLDPYEVIIDCSLLEDNKHCRNVCKRFIEASSVFGVNHTSFKLATAFLLLRLLRINDEESWNESSIGLLHSSMDERNVGKSLTLDLLAKGQGVATRKHPTMLAGGDQNQCGATVPVIRDILAKTNLMVMIDDPIISTNLAELLLQVQSGLTMGSRNAGMITPGGSLLLTSNSTVTQRAEGRVLVFQYRKSPFSSEAERDLDAGVRAIAAQNKGFLLAWAIKMKCAWQELMPDIFADIKSVLDALFTKMQPRWIKGIGAVIATHAIFHASAGINPDTCKVVAEVINQNQTVQKEDTVTRLQRSVLAKLETDESNVLTWLNPTVKVPVKEKFVTSIGIKASALEGFAQVSVKEVSNWLRVATDCKKSTSLSFANSESCTLDDLKKRNEKCKSYRGWKVPISLLNADVLSKLQERCGCSLALTEEHAGCSTEGDAEGTAPEEQMKPGKLDEFQAQLDSLDLYLLKYFEDYQEQPQPQSTEARNNFATNLTPESKNMFNNFSPRSRSVFKQGFEVAKRLHDKQAVSGPSNPSTSTCSQDNQEHLQTPGHANATTDSAGTRKRLFPAGTIGVLPRHAKHPKQNEDLCAKCHQTSPYKKKTWSRIWIMCDACSQWYHKECANLKTVPKEDETWVCQGCGKK